MAGILSSISGQRTAMPAYAIPVSQTADELNKRRDMPAPETNLLDPNKNQNTAAKVGKATQMLTSPPLTLQNPGNASKLLGY